MRHNLLLEVDGAINLLLGIGLMAFPRWLVDALGIPASTESFYRVVLGAILFGIGLALFVERFRGGRRFLGLGLGGAIAINVCGAIAVALWLVGRAEALPARGQVVLWVVVLVLLGLSSVELANEVRGQLASGRHDRTV